MTNFGKKIIVGGALVLLFIIVLFIWRWVSVFNNELENVNSLTNGEEQLQNEIKVFEPVELKTQKDFKMIGEEIYSGTGFEPGFYFKLNLAGNKFGLDMTTQNGLDGNGGQYVGYISLTNQSTSTKTFSGKVLDIYDQMQDINLQITNKKCIKASGDETSLSVKIKVGNNSEFEDLKGCGEMKI